MKITNYKRLGFLFLGLVLLLSGCLKSESQVDVSPPAGIDFTDFDLDAGKLGGKILISKADNETNVDDYVLYWGTNNTRKFPGLGLIAILSKTGFHIKYVLPNGVVAPDGATHIIAASRGGGGRSEAVRSILIQDTVGLQFGSARQDHYPSIALDHTGDVYISGVTGGEMFTDFHYAMNQFQDLFLAKFDGQSLEKIWITQHGSLHNEVAGGVTVVGERVYVAASTHGSMWRLRRHNYREQSDIVFTKHQVVNGDFAGAPTQFGADDVYLNDKGNAIAERDGMLFIVGQSPGRKNPYQELTLENAQKDVMIALYEMAHDKFFWTTMGGVEDDEAYDVAVDSQSNIYVAGCTEGNFFGDHKGKTDAFIFKARAIAPSASAATEHVKWKLQPSTEAEDCGKNVVTDSKDNVYLVGDTDGTMIKENKGVMGALSDVFIIKYDSNGRILWKDQVGGQHDDWAAGAAVDSQDNVYVLIYARSSIFEDNPSGEAPDQNPNRGDIVLVKYNSAGARLWGKQFGNTADERPQDIVIDRNDNVYIVGDIRWGALTGSPLGEDDLFLIKMKF